MKQMILAASIAISTTGMALADPLVLKRDVATGKVNGV